jgi:hypothetical protein
MHKLPKLVQNLVFSMSGGRGCESGDGNSRDSYVGRGVAANATPRQVRGEIKPAKTDGNYRAALRGASTQHRARQEAVKRELAGGQVKTDPGKDRLLETRSHPRVTRQSSVVIGVWASVHLRTFLSSRYDSRGNCDVAAVGKSDAFYKMSVQFAFIALQFTRSEATICFNLL